MTIKRLINVILILLVLISCKNEKLLTEDIENINRNISYYKITYQSSLYFENGELMEKDKNKVLVEYFDKNNNVIKEYRPIYGFSYQIIEYDTNGNEIGLKMFNEQGYLTYKNIFTLNENGKIVSIVSYNKNDKYDGKSYILYDYYGNVIQNIVYDENDKFNNSIIYALDINGRLYSSTQFFYSDHFPTVSIFSYKIDGKLHDIQSFGNGHKQTLYEILEYDSDGRETKSISYVFRFNDEQIPSTIQYYEYNIVE